MLSGVEEIPAHVRAEAVDAGERGWELPLCGRCRRQQPPRTSAFRRLVGWGCRESRRPKQRPVCWPEEVGPEQGRQVPVSIRAHGATALEASARRWPGIDHAAGVVLLPVAGVAILAIDGIEQGLCESEACHDRRSSAGLDEEGEMHRVELATVRPPKHRSIVRRPAPKVQRVEGTTGRAVAPSLHESIGHGGIEMLPQWFNSPISIRRTADVGREPSEHARGNFG